MPTLKATLEEWTRSPEETLLAAQLERAFDLFVATVTKNERQATQLAELRLESTKKNFDSDPSGINSRRLTRARADLVDAQKALLRVELAARETFAEAINKSPEKETEKP